RWAATSSPPRAGGRPRGRNGVSGRRGRRPGRGRSGGPWRQGVRALWSCVLQGHDGGLRAEGEGQRDRQVELGVAGPLGDVVVVALGVRRAVVGGRGQPLVVE